MAVHEVSFVPLPIRGAMLSAAILFGIWSSSSIAHAASYTLTVEQAKTEINGRTVEKMTINGGVPGPTLRLKEGEDATITVVNKTDEPTSVHWHGILLPGIMDGSPGFNGFQGIAPGASYTYTFKIRQSGTYWYHSHSGTQDQSVLGAIVIDPKDSSPFRTDRDYVVLFGDATHEDSDQVLRNLKADPGYYNFAKRTLGDRRAWGEMRMDPTDLADVTGYAFLANGKSPSENETLIFRKGERIRLRLINGAAMSFFDVRIPGLKMTVVAADGNDVNPVTVDELRIGVAERYDIIVEPKEDIAYTLFAESIDRAGYARVTFAPRAGMAGPIPERRPRTLLTLDDMGMAHGDHGDSARMDHGAMAGMDHTAMGHDMAGMDMSSTPESEAADPARPRGWGAGFPEDAKVLRYEDLKALRWNADTGEPSRIIELRLTGNMERYVWTLNDVRFDAAEAIRVRYGERVRLTFVNETMMAHPMHLHGMFFELENGQTDRKPLKDTVIVPPGKSVSVVLTAREVGGWPLHCHLLYHMASGMMTTFVVEPPGAAESALTPDHGVVPVAVEGGAGGHVGHGMHAR
jgi:CopA family copper-resistance protein